MKSIKQSAELSKTSGYLMKLSPAQHKALLVIRQNGGSIVANGMIASRNRVTFATLESLSRKGLLESFLRDSQWHYVTK